MKICLAIHSLSSGGMERVMSELAIYFFGKPDVQVHLILFGRKRELFYQIPDSVIVHKPEFEFLDSKRFIHTIKTLFFLRKSIKIINPDTILGFGEYWNNLLLLAGLGLDYHIFISDRSQPNKNIGFFHNLLRRYLYKQAAGFVAQTKIAGEIALKKNRNSNIRIIGNPIRKISLNPDILKENIVLTVGRLIKTKNLDQLIRIFTTIKKPGWKLVIVGGDSQKQNLMHNLQQLINELHAQEFIELAGSQTDVDSYYNKSKIFAFTSSSEGFPNVLGEAMRAGLPVISFNCIAGPSEMISNNKNGFLIPLFDYELFEKKIKQLMEDDNLRDELGRNAQRSIKEFSTDVIGEKFYSFITNNKLLN